MLPGRDTGEGNHGQGETGFQGRDERRFYRIV